MLEAQLTLTLGNLTENASWLPWLLALDLANTSAQFCLLCLAPCEGIQDSLGLWISRRGFRIPWNWILEFGFRTPFISVILVSLSCIPESKAHYSGFHKQKFPRFRNMDFLTDMTDTLALLFSRSINQICLAIWNSRNFIRCIVYRQNKSFSQVYNSFCSKGGAGGDRNSCSMSTKTLDMKSKWINDLTEAM